MLQTRSVPIIRLLPKNGNLCSVDQGGDNKYNDYKAKERALIAAENDIALMI